MLAVDLGRYPSERAAGIIGRQREIDRSEATARMPVPPKKNA